MLRNYRKCKCIIFCSLRKVQPVIRVKMDFVWLCWIATRCCCHPCLSGYTHVMRIYEAPFSRGYCLIKVPSYWDVFQGSCFNINILLLQVEHFLRNCPLANTTRPHWLLLKIGSLKVMALCWQATSHYGNQCCDAIWHQWVNSLWPGDGIWCQILVIIASDSNHHLKLLACSSSVSQGDLKYFHNQLT